MLTKYFLLILIMAAIAGCNANTATTPNNAVVKQDSVIKDADKDKQAEAADSIKHSSLNKLKIVNQKDPVCGMSMIRGFDDTATYKKKLIGFCSKECKDEFVKKPVAYKIR